VVDLLRLRLPRDRPPRPVAEMPVGAPVVVFVPAHNEAPRLGSVLDRVPSRVAGRPVVTVVVDDGSTDATACVARRHGATVVSHGINRGLGAAVRTGFAAAASLDAAVVAFCDGDGEYDPAELPALVAPILDGSADYVVGSRFAGTIGWMRPHRRLGNRILTRWVRWTTREPVSDGQSGFRALGAGAARDVEIAHDYNYAQVLTIDLLGRGWRYCEVPISYRFRRSGRSFVRLGTYLRHVVPAVHRLLAEVHARTSLAGDVGDHPPVRATGAPT
jgi:glycosyltransferase involved in cell wall biosynthesis